MFVSCGVGEEDKAPWRVEADQPLMVAFVALTRLYSLFDYFNPCPAPLCVENAVYQLARTSSRSSLVSENSGVVEVRKGSGLSSSQKRETPSNEGEQAMFERLLASEVRVRRFFFFPLKDFNPIGSAMLLCCHTPSVHPVPRFHSPHSSRHANHGCRSWPSCA